MSYLTTSTIGVLFLIFLLSATIQTTNANEPPLEIINEWKNLVFGFETAAQEQYAIQYGQYNPNSQMRPYDSDIYVTPDGDWREFLSVPRVQRGVPFTLAEVTGVITPKGPTLKAFPNVEMHLERKCQGLHSVFRIWVQQDCHLLWAIDCGRDFFPPTPNQTATQLCPPKIVAFDLTTNQLVFSHEIPSDFYTPEVSVFNGITLAPSLTCDRTIGYVTDARGPGLVVFRRRKNDFESWRITSEYFKADARYYNTTVANESFNFIDGLYTAAPTIRNQMLYFHPFASLSEYGLPLYLANVKQLWRTGNNLDYLFTKFGERPTQSSIEVVDARGNLFFTLMDPTLGIFCWKPGNPYNAANFKLVLENSEVFQLVIGLKARKVPGMGQVLIGISNRLQKHNTGTVNPNEVNYRMFSLPIKNINCNPNV